MIIDHRIVRRNGILPPGVRVLRGVAVAGLVPKKLVLKSEFISRNAHYLTKKCSLVGDLLPLGQE
ncbi:hypothetical protein AB835_11595 [Candidatus Endobugula sertula]|uniref:Uncharacterized protein n=1 Tax=Candidatus Endobugula sertula TaxID=62101 RepID=A0A1D2QMZ3_9GAMM|nr:hypothetical protein AB835_11595 [Candidatus Endobugula sertula]